MGKNLWIIAALAIVLVGPLALRTKQAKPQKVDRTLVIISPHNEAIRYEFEHAFDAYHFQKTGEHVRIDWRVPGGTSEISRYLASEYQAAFENYWRNQLHRPWSAQVQNAFDNPKAPQDASDAAQARKEFLASHVSCGVDLFFGGGSFDFIQQANAGRLVDCGIIAAHPDLFNDKVIPQQLGGEPYWDPQGRWIGVCVSSFGICYNTDVLHLLKIDKAPAQWSDLTDPRYFGELTLANPAQSGSIGKAFEMIIQQQMLELIAKTPGAKVDAGWTNALQMIQKISANARYFTDDAKKIPFDVESGNASAGMCIDFYGRFQSESVRKPDGTSRMQYITPEGGSSIGADPIGMLRGAPDTALAREFIEFTISPEGQKLWNWKVGTPDGPTKYALRRLPILPTLYSPEYASFRSDPQEDPYLQARAFQYHAEWTAALFRPIGFVVRVLCIEPHEELREAWKALIDNHFPPQATSVFLNVSKVDYAAASGIIRDTLRSPQKVDEMRLAKELGEGFRAQYRKAAELAREGK